MDFKKLTTGDWIVGGGGIVLFIGLLFLPWHDIEFGPFSESRSAIESPNAFWGWLALILAVALVATVVLRKLTTVDLPDLPISWGDAQFYGSIAVLALLLIKLISETDFLGWFAWVGLIISAGIVYGGFLLHQDEAKAGAAGGGGEQF